MSETEDHLLARVQRGDGDALMLFIENHQGRLLHFIQNQMSTKLARKIEASDILQETMLTAFESFRAVDFSDRNPYGWLCHLAERRIIDAHRRLIAAGKRSRAMEATLGEFGSDSQQSDFINLLIASMTTPSQALDREHKHQVLAAAIATLSEEQRNALHLRYLRGLSIDEIATAIGKSNGAVRVMLSRTLAKLHTLLIGHQLFQDGGA